MSFTEEEIAYLGTQRLARIATVSDDGQPDVMPVGYQFDGKYFYVGGMNHSEVPERAGRKHEGSSRHRRSGIRQSVDGSRPADLRQCRTPRSPGRLIRTGPVPADYAHRFVELEPRGPSDHTQPEGHLPARRPRSCGQAKRIAAEIDDE